MMTKNVVLLPDTSDEPREICITHSRRMIGMCSTAAFKYTLFNGQTQTARKSDCFKKYSDAKKGISHLYTNFSVQFDPEFSVKIHYEC